MKLLTLLAACTAIAIAEPVPVPKTSKIPATQDSHPFMAADHTLQPPDLAKHGYVEEEFLVSGTANVYNWATDGSLTVKTPNAPYADRILVRHPSNPSRFSGTVVVELLNSARRFDWAMMWGYSGDYFMSHGDAWVGVTMPGAVAGLKKFNPARYEALSFANPTPEEQCTAGRGRGRGRGRGGPSNVEQGLQWDMLSQIAAALKSGAPGEPMAGFKVARVFMTTQSGDIVTYINAIHSHARLENGKPAYDGYMIKNPGGAVRIANCAAAPGRNDPRRLVHDVDVPVIGVVAQGEVLANLASRRPDSDNPSGRYRLYEIAGAAHIDKYPYTALPSFADQIAAVGSAQGTPEWPFAAQCDPPIPLSGHPLLKFSYDAAFANLDAWVRKGMPPPHADRIKIEGEGTPQASIALDQFGNAEGGVRSPYVDVPAATYYTTSPGPGTCRELGHDVKFSAERLKMLYGGDRQYAAKVSQSAGRMEKARLITKADEQAMITDLKAK